METFAESVVACVSQNIYETVARSSPSFFFSFFFYTELEMLLVLANQKRTGISKMALSLCNEEKFTVMEMPQSHP